MPYSHSLLFQINQCSYQYQCSSHGDSYPPHIIPAQPRLRLSVSVSGGDEERDVTQLSAAAAAAAAQLQLIPAATQPPRTSRPLAAAASDNNKTISDMYEATLSIYLASSMLLL